MEKLEKYEEHRDLFLAMKVGALLTASGAEIRRVETTMEHIIQHVDGNIAHCNCTPGSITATVTYPQGSSKTMVLRVGPKNTDFKKIIRLNELSRKYSKQEWSYDDACAEYDSIVNMRIPPLFLRSTLNALCCSAFTFILSPTVGDVSSSLIIGFLSMVISEKIYSKFVVSTFLQTLITSALITILTFLFCHFGLGVSPNHIIVGAVTPILPGVETINAVRDIVEGDYLSAVSRILNAILLGSAIAVGVVIPYLIITM